MVQADVGLIEQLAANPESGPYWQVEEGIRLYHFQAGRRPDVLVLHGGPGYPPQEPYDGAFRLLEDRYTLHYYHQRGCGLSSRPIDSFAESSGRSFPKNMKLLVDRLGVAAQIADIERIRRILGLERLMIVGHSFGGFLAALYAAEFPDRVARLVLVAPAEMIVMPQRDSGLYQRIEAALPSGPIRGEYQDYLRRSFDFRRLFEKDEAELSELNREFTRYYAAAASQQGWSQTVVMPAAGSVGGWHVQGLYMSLGRRYDHRDALKRIIAPALVINGTRDFYSPEDRKLYTDLIPRAKLLELDFRHFPFLEKRRNSPPPSRLS